MQIIDFVILAILVIGLVIGVVRGFIGQLLTLLGIVVVAIGTSYLFRYPQQWLVNVIPNEQIVSIVSIVLTAIVILIVYSILAKIISKIFKAFTIMKVIDRILGAVLSVAVVYALMAIFVELLTRTDIEFMAKINEVLAPQTENSLLINTVYENNFFGKWILDVISDGISQIMPQA